MIKRITALLLAFLMMVSAVPAPAYAVGESAAAEPDAAAVVTEENTEERAICPTCGADDCVSDHSGWCAECGKDNCGTEHVVPPTDEIPFASPYRVDIGKKATFNPAYISGGSFPVSTDPAGETSWYEAEQVPGSAISPELTVVIVDVFDDGKTCWYKVTAAPGHTLPDAMTAKPWVYQNDVGASGGESLLVQTVQSCEICGEENCGTTHVRCAYCGSYDCTVDHGLCAACGLPDCTRIHLACIACGSYDCTKTHVLCSSCGKYDCKETHSSLTPATAPVLPEFPVLPAGEDENVYILDAEGNCVSSLSLIPRTQTSLSAWSNGVGGNCTYRWQIRYDAVNDRWADIQGQTGRGILFSPAMVQSVLSRQGSAALRCVMTAGESSLASAPVPVSIAADGENGAASGTSDSAVSVAAEEESGEELQKHYVVVQYLYEDGRTAAATDFASIIPGSAYSHSYLLPGIPGYKAALNTHSYGDKAAIADGSLVLNFAAGDLTAEYTIFTVTYVADYVNYTVIHYWQNAENDYYTEHARETVSNTHKTGDVIENAHKSYPGFYHLLYETPTAAADGSTVIEIYYDRYYYLMTFDLGNMGYGVDPIYARYGTQIKISTPTRAGYAFHCWTNSAGTEVSVPDTMPEGGGTYYANWSARDTGYRVSYWIVNKDGTRTLVGSHVEYGVSGTMVSGVDNLGTPDGTICGEELHHIHDAECYSCKTVAHEHTAACFDGTLTITDPLDDGRAVIRAVDDGRNNPESGYIYVIYSIESGQYWPKLYLEDENGNGVYYVINGTEGGREESSFRGIIEGDALATGAFADLTVAKYKPRTDCAAAQHVHDASCSMICTIHTHTDACYQDTSHLEYIAPDDMEDNFRTESNVVINGDGSSVVNVYYRYKEYTLKFYYAASTTSGTETIYKIVGGCSYFFGQDGPNTSDDEQLLENQYWNHDNEWGKVSALPTLNARGEERKYTKGSETFDHNGTAVTYHYISFNARFGDDISGMWPCAVFNSATRTDKNSANGWAGNEAFVSAWNGEHHVKYSQDNSNETIKGVYEKLDENLLFASGFADEQTISYLCFWENGANIGWSVPELYRYNIYLEAYSGQDLSGKTTVTIDGITYYLADTYDTCDNSTVGEQTQVSLTGYDPVTFSTAYARDGFLHAQISGSWPARYFEYKMLTGTNSETLKQQDGYFDAELYKEGYEVNFYYKAKKYRFSFWNHDGYLTNGTGSMVAFEEPLYKYFEGITIGDTVYDGANDLIRKPEYYPESLEPDAYRFEGWYTSPQFQSETKVDPNTAVMPDEALMVYTRWVPVTRTVKFFLSATSLNVHKTIPEEMKELWESKLTEPYPSDSPYDIEFATRTDVINGSYLIGVSNPEVSEGYDAVHPFNGYEFQGWFYRNDAGEETAFDLHNMPVTQDLNLYGKWSSNKMCYYNVYFALDADNDGVADVDADGNVIYVADSISGSGIAGRTYTFAAKGGGELYDPAEETINYQEGYFPNVGSHSIVIDIADEEGTAANSFTFLYKPKEAVPYTVRYLDKDTGESLFADKVAEDNKDVVVTENFLYKQGYMPDAYQKTLVVTDDAENDVIIFYYTKDEAHALYVVNYYIQELDAGLNHAGWNKYTDLQSTGVIGKEYSADAISIAGFTLSESYTNRYNRVDRENGMNGTGLPAEVSALTNGRITGELTDKGMELNFYYTRNLYPYEFRFMLNGTTTRLAPSETGKAGYDKIVSMGAKEIVMDLDGDGIPEDYRLFDATAATRDIHIKVDPGTADNPDQATVNIATFYYVRCTQTMTITKTVVDESGTLDKNRNGVIDAGEAPEFDFSLLIHSLSGYHVSSYAYTKSDGETGTLSPEYSAPNTLQFTLKAGQTITIEGLPTAEYTVSERDLPTGYYDTWSPARKNKLTVDGRTDITVTNTYDPANLVLSKTVNISETDTNIPEVLEFSFAIAVPAGVTGTYTYLVDGTSHTAAVTDGVLNIRLKNRQTATFSNLPLGLYQVTEEDYAPQGYKSNVSINGGEYTESRTAEVSMTRGTTTDVNFANIFPVGDLTIEKTLTKEYYGSPWNGDTFTFTVERTTMNRPLLATNRYELWEDGGKVGEAAVDADGKLTVTITYDAQDAAKLDEAEEKDVSLVRKLVIKNLPAGTYRVTENENADYVQTPADRTVKDLAIPAEEGAVASFANELIRTTGHLQVGKTIRLVADETIIDTEQAFTFEVILKDTHLSGPYVCVIRSRNGTPDDTTDDIQVADTAQSLTADAEGVLTFCLKHDQYILISDLPIGDYEVRELAIEGYNSSFGDVQTLPGNYSVDPATITEAQTTILSCENAYPVYYSSLTVKKTVVTPEGNSSVDQAPADDRFTYALHFEGYSDKVDPNRSGISAVFHRNAADTAGSAVTLWPVDDVLTFELMDGQWYDLNLPVCTYTLEETGMLSTVNTTGTLTDHYDVSWTSGVLAGTGTRMGSSLVSGEEETVVFTNTYQQHVGTLTVSKTAAGGSADNIFIFRITGSGVDMDVTITGSGSVTIHDLPLGEYSVAEDTQWSWRYKATGNAVQNVTLSSAAPDAAAEFTNALQNNKWLSGISVVRNLFTCTGSSND